MRTDSLRIVSKTYRGKAGFFVCGRASDGKARGLFTESRATAEALKAAIRKDPRDSAAVAEIYLGRRPAWAEVAARTGFQIICATGLYKETEGR